MSWNNLSEKQQHTLYKIYCRNDLTESTKRHIVTNYLMDWRLMKFQSLIFNALVKSNELTF